MAASQLAFLHNRGGSKKAAALISNGPNGKELPLFISCSYHNSVLSAREAVDKAVGQSQ